jgi:hypothetical protein
MNNSPKTFHLISSCSVISLSDDEGHDYKANEDVDIGPHPWRWRQYVPPKRWYLPVSAHGLTTHKTNISYIVNAVLNVAFFTLILWKLELPVIIVHEFQFYCKRSPGQHTHLVPVRRHVAKRRRLPFPTASVPHRAIALQVRLRRRVGERFGNVVPSCCNNAQDATVVPLQLNAGSWYQVCVFNYRTKLTDFHETWHWCHAIAGHFTFMLHNSLSLIRPIWWSCKLLRLKLKLCYKVWSWNLIS